jgi:hypothetical protein
MSRGQRNGFLQSLISVFLTGAATFPSSSSSVVLTRLSGPRSRPTASQKINPHGYFRHSVLGEVCLIPQYIKEIVFLPYACPYVFVPTVNFGCVKLV